MLYIPSLPNFAIALMLAHPTSHHRDRARMRMRVDVTPVVVALCAALRQPPTDGKMRTARRGVPLHCLYDAEVSELPDLPLDLLK